MRSQRRRGFTLVELMIAVVIMGTLATLAVYGVMGAVRKSHLHEPIRMVGAIKAAQEAYRSETGVYLDVCAGDLSKIYPFTKATLGNGVAAWAPTAATEPLWAALGVDATGGMRFGYATIAGNGTQSLQKPDEYKGDFTAPVTSPPLWYQVQSTGDLNQDGLYTVVYGSSLSDELGVVQEEGYVAP